MPKGSRSSESWQNIPIEVRRMRGRLGAYRQQSKHDPRDTTRAARAALDLRFLNEVDPDRLLPEAERNRRAEAARRAFYVELALKSARVRSLRAKADALEAEVDAEGVGE